MTAEAIPFISAWYFYPKCEGCGMTHRVMATRKRAPAYRCEPCAEQWNSEKRRAASEKRTATRRRNAAERAAAEKAARDAGTDFAGRLAENRRIRREASATRGYTSTGFHE